MRNKTQILSVMLFMVTVSLGTNAVNVDLPDNQSTTEYSNCRSASFPSLTFSDSHVFPLDRSLKHPEDGRALPDGRIIVGDENSGLRIIDKDGKSRAFGKFKELGWVHDPPKTTAGPNGVFMENDGRHLLLADVYAGTIYRIDIKTEATKLIYKHPFGINSLVRDSKGTIWFTQSARNVHEKGAADLFAAVNIPVDSGSVFYLKSSGDEFESLAVEAAANIYFANGIALDKEEKYLYVAETMMDRVLRFQIDIDKKTLSKRETYQSVLTPDNLGFDKDGNLMIASPGSNSVLAVDKKCRSLHTIFSAPSAGNAKAQDEWTTRSRLGKPLLEVFTPDLWNPLPGALTGMFWSQDFKTLYVTGLGNAVLKVETVQEPPVKAQITELLKTTKSWNGVDLPEYPKGKPEIIISKAVIPPKTKLDFHKHPVINAIVLTKGELTIVTEKGETIRLKAGDAYAEVVDSWHYGENKGAEPVEGFIFYAGVEGTPVTVAKP